MSGHGTEYRFTGDDEHAARQAMKLAHEAGARISAMQVAGARAIGVWLVDLRDVEVQWLEFEAGGIVSEARS